MRKAYLKVIELIALISLPLGVFFYKSAGPIIRILWGENWFESIPVFQVLALLTMIQPIVSTSGSIFLSNNQAGLLFKIGCLNSLIMIAGITFGLPHGIVGVATGYALSYTILVLPITMGFVMKTLNLNVFMLLDAVKRPLLIALVLFGGLYLLRNITERFDDVISLIITVALSVVIFIFGIFISYRKDAPFNLLKYREVAK